MSKLDCKATLKLRSDAKREAKRLLKNIDASLAVDHLRSEVLFELAAMLMDRAKPMLLGIVPLKTYPTAP